MLLYNIKGVVGARGWEFSSEGERGCARVCAHVQARGLLRMQERLACLQSVRIAQGPALVRLRVPTSIHKHA